jgi:hypothetical protein
MKHILIPILGVLLLNSCIKTDFIEETEVPAKILITTNISSLKIGDQIQLSAIYSNNYGYTEEETLQWTSLTPDVLNISSAGLAVGVKEGIASILVKAKDAETNLTITVTNDGNINPITSTRSGVFRSAGAGSYKVEGDVSIITEDGKSKIIVSENFKASTGPSLFLMLTNHTNGSYMVVNNNPVINGISAQISLTRLIKFQGEMSWDVPEGVDVKNYKYALLYCTLGPVFGFAELK